MTKLPFFFFLLLPLVSGEIKTLQLSNDSRPLILLDHFRFTDTGHVTVSVSSISVIGSPELARFGFFLLPEASKDSILSVRESNSSLCLLDLNYVDMLFTFYHSSSFNLSYTVTSPGEYFLYFQRCVSRGRVSMELRTELYNIVDREGREVKDFLSPDFARWPILYFGFSAVYITVLSFLVCVCVRYRKSVRRIHILMCVLVLAKALSLRAKAEEMHYVRVTGTTPIRWDILFYVFEFVGDVVLFAVIALLGAGWSILRRSLEERENFILVVVIVLRVLANVASVMIGVTGPLDNDWVMWYLFMLVADFICCVAVVPPVVWLIGSLEKTLKRIGGKAAAKRLAKLALFKQFHMVVTGYLYFTRIAMLAGRIVVPYTYQVVYAAVEIANLAFCGIVCYMFRPVEKNEYFQLDEEAAEMALSYEKFEL